MKLYHFTCADHGAQRILEDGEIRPRLHPVLCDTFAWFTPFAGATARQLGLTRGRLSCNRMEHRFQVDVDPATALAWTSIRDQFGQWEVELLESAKGARPDIWYITRVPVPLPHHSGKEES